MKLKIMPKQLLVDTGILAVAYLFVMPLIASAGLGDVIGLLAAFVLLHVLASSLIPNL